MQEETLLLADEPQGTLRIYDPHKFGRRRVMCICSVITAALLSAGVFMMKVTTATTSASTTTSTMTSTTTSTTTTTTTTTAMTTTTTMTTATTTSTSSTTILPPTWWYDDFELTGKNLSRATCRTIFDSKHTSTFYGIWGTSANIFRDFKFGKITDGCWNKHGNQKFFRENLEGVHCDRNWVVPFSGGPEDRPRYTAPAPALLGFDVDLGNYCCKVLGVNPCVHTSENSLAGDCLAANQNTLRLYDPSYPWDLCVNLQWEMCAVSGKLPGQDQAKMHWAVAPKDLPASLYWTVNATKGTYDNYPVTTVEICIISEICNNADEFWLIEAGELFTCDLNVSLYWKLANALMSPTQG